jgi:CheY-like chemotaxis protein
MAVEPPWRVLAVDDESDVLGQIKEFLSGEEVDEFGSTVTIDTTTSFDEALEMLESTRYDLLILDVRIGSGDGNDSEAGVRTLQRIRERRFLPVIFNTAIPGAVEGLKSPLVRVVEKTRGVDALLEEVRDLFKTQLPEINRVLIEHVEAVQRDYMWDFVAPNWQTFGGSSDRSGLAHLLARRLALSLSGDGVEKLAARLGDSEAVPSGGLVEPMRYYVLPPVEQTPLAGDIYKGSIGEVSGEWVLLTPSCDLANEPVKAEFVLLARCIPLEDQPEYETWHSKLPTPSSTVVDEIKRLLRNSRKKGQADRIFFLPAALTVPNLIIDFQQVEKLRADDLTKLDRIASLDSPFAEALIARFTRYFGRVGTPDLNVDAVMSRLRREAGHDDQARAH